MLKEVLDGLLKVLGPITTLSKDKREQKDNALRTISTALDETYLYYRDLDNGGSRNFDREAMLVKYWSAAAIPIRHFDQTLASICNYKAEYWVNPENYNQEDINTLGIGLDDVRLAYRKMLSPKSS